MRVGAEGADEVQPHTTGPNSRSQGTGSASGRRRHAHHAACWPNLRVLLECLPVLAIRSPIRGLSLDTTLVASPLAHCLGLIRLAARTAVVAGTAVTGATTARKQAAAAEQQAAAARHPSPRLLRPAAPIDVVAELQKLASLKEAGVVFDEEFTAAKAKILRRPSRTRTCGCQLAGAGYLRNTKMGETALGRAAKPLRVPHGRVLDWCLVMRSRMKRGL